MRRLAFVALVLLAVAAPAYAASPGSGPALSVAIDPAQPQTVWAVSNAGLRRSDDGGATFRPVAIVQDGPITFSSGALRSVTATGGAVIVADQFSTFRSGDGGAHWTRIPVDGDRDVAVSPSDPSLLFGTELVTGPIIIASAARALTPHDLCLRLRFSGHEPRQLIVSHDAGASWQPISVPSPIPQLPVDPRPVPLAGGGLIALADDALTDGGERVLRSTDEGAHWTDITSTWPTQAGVPVADATTPGRLWLRKARRTLREPDRLVRSDDLGATFTDVGPAPPGDLGSSVTGLHATRSPGGCPPSSPLAAGPGLQRSITGAAFTDDAAGLLPSLGVQGYAAAAGTEAIATPFGVFHRSGSGPWTPAATAVGPGIVRILARDGARYLAGTPDGAFLSPDRGRTWTPVAGLPANPDVQSLAARRGRIALAVRGDRASGDVLFEGLAGGTVVPIAGIAAGSAVRGLAYERSGALLVLTHDRLLRLRDGAVSELYRFGREARGLVLDRDGRLRITVGAVRPPAQDGSGALLTSTDGGRHFGGRAIPGGILSARLYPAGRGFYLDTEALGFVLASTGVGLRFRFAAPLATIDSRSRIVALQRLPRVAWIAGARGIWRTHDFGETWRPLRFPPASDGTAVMLDGRYLVTATAGEGVRRQPLVIGDLTVPRLIARYDARSGRIIGHVRDRHVPQVVVDWETTRVHGDDGDFDQASVAADGSFAVRVGHLHGRWRIDVVAHDGAGNSSRHVRIELDGARR